MKEQRRRGHAHAHTSPAPALRALFCAVALAALAGCGAQDAPNDTAAIIARTKTLAADGKIAEAVAILRDAQQKMPADVALARARAYTNKMYASEINEREAWREAVDAFDKYLELVEGKDAKAHLHLVQMLLDCRAFAEAAQECLDKLQHTPQDIEYTAHLGFALQQQGKYEHADPFLQKAADSAGDARVKWWRADNERLLGEYKKSLDHFEALMHSGAGLMNPAYGQYYRIAQWLAQETPSAQALRCHLDLAERHDHVCRNDRLATEAETALRLAPQERGPAQWTDIARAHHIIGKFQDDMGKEEEALDHHLKAIAAYERSDVNGEIAWVYQSMADVYSALARCHPEQEKEYYEKALAARIQQEQSALKYNKDHMARHALCDKASAMSKVYGLDDERVTAARQQMAQLIPETGPLNDCSIAANVSVEFNFRFQKKDYDSAQRLADLLVPYYETSFSMEHHYRAPTLFHTLAQIAMIDQKYDDAAQWCARGARHVGKMRSLLGTDEFRRQVGQTASQELFSLLIKAQLAKKDQVAAFNASEEYKARALLDLLASREQGSQPHDTPPADPAPAPDTATTPAPAEDRVTTALRDLKLEQNACARLPENTDAGAIRIRSTHDVPVLTLTDLQPLVKDFCFISYVLGEEDAAVMVLNPDSLHVAPLENVTTQTIATLVDSFSKCITAASTTQRDLHIDTEGTPPPPPQDAELQTILQQLYTLLLAPVAPHIKTNTLCISADGPLNGIPFEILRNDGRYLIEDYAVSYIPSANVLKRCLDKNRTRHQSVLALGNPSLDNPALRLLNAETEVLALRTLFGKADIFINNDATENIIKQQAGAYDIVHVACHGELNSDNPMLTSLRLSPGPGEDGYLHAGEIFGLDLDNTALVVLSACSSGLGELSSGNELMGLTRSFLYAGAPSIIASLWSVDDRSTSELMQAFYANLNTMTKTQSLRQAKLALMKNYPHPFYWSPFCLQGDYR